MSPRLRSNWRPPARQDSAENANAHQEPVSELAEMPAPLPQEVSAISESSPPAAEAAESESSAAAPAAGPRPRTRRAPVRARAQTAPAEPAAAQSQAPSGIASGAAEPAAAEARPRRRQPARRRAALTPAEALAAEPQTEGAPAGAAAPETDMGFPQARPESARAQPAIAYRDAAPREEAPAAPEPLAEAEMGEAKPLPGAVSEALAPNPVEAGEAQDEAQSARGHRRRGQRGRRGRGGRGLAASEAGEAPAEAGPAMAAPATTAPDFEPLPPPTKRRAPRVIPGVRRARPAADNENAVDWALGRMRAPETPPATPAATPDEGETAVAARRRRSRRGRGGRTQMSDAPAAAAAEAEEPAALVSEEQFITAQQRRQQTPPAREERGRSQLSTFESLVARQNVVLDTLLARVSSFSSIERALTAVEHRLSNQGFGATGTAAPRVGIFVDVPNIIYAAERMGVTIDFGKLLRLLTHGRELVRASAYSPISDDPAQRLDVQKFVQPFVRGGYRIVTKPLKRFSDGTMKGNFDVELAIDVLTMAERLDVVSLVSGDGDFSRLVDIVGSKGVRVEVAAFGGSTSAELRAICDDYIDLTNILAEIT